MLLCSVMMMSFVLTACSKGSNSGADVPAAAQSSEQRLAQLNVEGMPIAKEKLTMSAFAAKFYASADWNKLMLWEQYEKLSNVHIKWETVQIDSLKEKRNIKLAGGEYPEIFFASAFSRSDLIKYGSQGTFIKLDDLIDTHAPNFKRIMEQYPIVKKGITMPDGSIYGLPTIFDPAFKSLYMGTPWMKQEWLRKLNMQPPTTLVELHAVLKAMKEKDPNGNGKPDEIPWGSRGVKQMINFLKGTYGFNKNGIANEHVDLDPKTGKLRFIPTNERYKELLQYMHTLYRDGLLDQETFTMKETDIAAKASQGLYGFLDGVDPAAIYNQKGFIGMPVLKGPSGERLATNVGSPLGNTGMFVLTDKAKHPEAAMRWIDHLYSDEGVKMFFMGFEGVTYKQKADGEFEYVEALRNNPDGLNLDQAISQYLTWPGGYYPGIVKQRFFKGAEGYPSSIANAKQAEPFTIKMDEVWPVFNFTPEEQEELMTIQTDIHTYIDEMRDKFITGAASFEEWDNYVAQISSMKVERYVAIYAAAYERFKAAN
ncbi:extracellular solute-binding protein [Paenibacillus sp. 481]|nr:extracellular solute-binding protein [Paenibacillus sp. 481]